MVPAWAAICRRLAGQRRHRRHALGHRPGRGAAGIGVEASSCRCRCASRAAAAASAGSSLSRNAGFKAFRRSSSGGCVANTRDKPEANNMCATCSASAVTSFEPALTPAILSSAPVRPEGSRVNCTAEASASRSR
jgi:hypothetical protein